MKSPCPVCGKKVSVFSRITQPIVCVDCEKARREIPTDVRQSTEAECDVTTGRLIALGAIVFGALVVFVPARQGAAPSSKFYLLSLAFVALGTGLKKIADAKRKLGSKLK